MGNTRSQVLRENRIEQSEEDSFTEDEDNVIVPDHFRKN